MVGDSGGKLVRPPSALRPPPSALRPPTPALHPPPRPVPTSAPPPAGVARLGLALGRQGAAAAVASPLVGGARGAGCPRGHGGPQLRGEHRGATAARTPGSTTPARGERPARLWRHGGGPPPRSSAPRRTVPHRAAPHRTAPHRTLQVLLERLAERSSSALHRTAAVRALTALLHQPRGMALFVDIPGGAAGATPAATRSRTAGASNATPRGRCALRGFAGARRRCGCGGAAVVNRSRWFALPVVSAAQNPGSSAATAASTEPFDAASARFAAAGA